MNASSRSGFSQGARFALALVAGVMLTACSEQRLVSVFDGDQTAPIVSIAKTKGDTMDVKSGLGFTVSAADNLGLKQISIVFTGGFTGSVDSIFRTAVTTTTLPVNVTFPNNTTAGGRVYIRVTATDGNNNTSVARDSVYLTNVDALIVQLFRPLPNSVASSGKDVLIVVQANQKDGIKKIGWIAAGVVTGSDSILIPPPGLPDTVVFTDTMTVPAAVTSGNFTLAGFAEDSSGRRVTTPTTLITVQSVASDATPPLVSFTVGQRVEVRDSITVRATDPSGITKLGFEVFNRATGVQVGGDSVNGSGSLTDVAQQFNLDLRGPAFATFPQEVIIRAFAVDAAGNRSEAVVGPTPASAIFRDTITVVNGITKPLPNGGRVADGIFNRNLNEIYLTNVLLNRLEIFSVTDTSFKTPISVGSRPWGIGLWPRDTLGNNADTVVVANSGGTTLSVVDLVARRERRRHALPNFLIQTVHTELSATNQIVIKFTEFEFSDRPEYLAMTCRPAGGTACPANAIYAVYSTTPTPSPAQTGDFGGRGTMRWENMNPAMQQSHFFWEHAQVSPTPEADSLQILVDRGPSFAADTVLSVACGVMVTLKELAFLDTTFVRNSGNFTHALIGEGGVGTPVRGFARAIGYSSTPGLTIGTCTGNIVGTGGVTVTFTGPLERDNGISPAIRVRDFISNTATGVNSIATNFNGLTNLIRADSVYVLNEGLRLMGLLGVAGDNAGMDLNFDHKFDATVAGTPLFGGTLSPNDRLVFVARPDAVIDAFDTYFYEPVASVAVRDPITGPLRVAKLLSGEQILVGVTARGVVTVRLPAITNTYPIKGWQAAGWGVPIKSKR